MVCRDNNGNVCRLSRSTASVFMAYRGYCGLWVFGSEKVGVLVQAVEMDIALLDDGKCLVMYGGVRLEVRREAAFLLSMP